MIGHISGEAVLALYQGTAFSRALEFLHFGLSSGGLKHLSIAYVGSEMVEIGALLGYF
jgi:hypothetical protein